MGERWAGGETTGLVKYSVLLTIVLQSIIVILWLCFSFCWRPVHLADRHFHPRTVMQTRINKYKHPHEASCGCYLRSSIRRIFTVCPIAVMRVQTASEIQPGFIKAKASLASCRWKHFYLSVHFSNIVLTLSRPVRQKQKQQRPFHGIAESKYMLPSTFLSLLFRSLVPLGAMTHLACRGLALGRDTGNTDADRGEDSG